MNTSIPPEALAKMPSKWWQKVTLASYRADRQQAAAELAPLLAEVPAASPTPTDELLSRLRELSENQVLTPYERWEHMHRILSAPSQTGGEGK